MIKFKSSPASPSKAGRTNFDPFDKLRIDTERSRSIKVQSFNKGFTLIEMVIYIAIVTVVVGIVVMFGFAAIRTGAKVKTNAEVLDNSRRAMETIIYEIKKSRSVYTPTSAFDTDPGQLSLEQATTTPVDETATFVDFFKCGDSLCLRREGSNPMNLTNDRVKVIGLVFTQLSNSSSRPSVQIRLRLESVNASLVPDYSSSIDLTSTAILRGY